MLLITDLIISEQLFPNYLSIIRLTCISPFVAATEWTGLALSNNTAMACVHLRVFSRTDCVMFCRQKHSRVLGLVFSHIA